MIVKELRKAAMAICFWVRLAENRYGHRYIMSAPMVMPKSVTDTTKNAK